MERNMRNEKFRVDISFIGVDMQRLIEGIKKQIGKNKSISKRMARKLSFLQKTGVIRRKDSYWESANVMANDIITLEYEVSSGFSCLQKMLRIITVSSIK